MNLRMCLCWRLWVGGGNKRDSLIFVTYPNRNSLSLKQALCKTFSCFKKFDKLRTSFPSLPSVPLPYASLEFPEGFAAQGRGLAKGSRLHRLALSLDGNAVALAGASALRRLMQTPCLEALSLTLSDNYAQEFAAAYVCPPLTSENTLKNNIVYLLRKKRKCIAAERAEL